MQAVEHHTLGSPLETLFADLWVEAWPDLDLHAQYSDVELWEQDFHARREISRNARRYAADFAYVPGMLLIEIDGSIWVQGGHNTGRGRMRDCRKDMLAAMSGWRVIRLAGEEMVTMEYVQAIGESIKGCLTMASIELLAQVKS